jgi:hypothetical protein
MPMTQLVKGDFFFSSSMRAFSFLYFNDRWFIYKFNKDNIIIIFKKKEKIRIKKNKKNKKNTNRIWPILQCWRGLGITYRVLEYWSTEDGIVLGSLSAPKVRNISGGLSGGTVSVGKSGCSSLSEPLNLSKRNLIRSSRYTHLCDL